MKTLSMVIFAILSTTTIQALGEPGIFYPEGEERALPPPPLPPAAMRVVGEIRSVDESKQPRLWGEGRPGTLRYGQLADVDLCINGEVAFGLSHTVTNWGTSPSACPVGTWVCTKAEIVGTECDTDRPDSEVVDQWLCDLAQVNLPKNGHRGWLADVYNDDKLNGSGMNEGGYLSGHTICNFLPVWCCSEYKP